MPDRENVMSCLEGLAQQDWRMFHSDSEVQEIARNALELLEEDCHNCKLECLLKKYDELKEKYDALLEEQKPVIRCKDCKKWHTNCLPSCGRHGCDVFGDYTKPDDFCSFAERRERR